MKFQDTTLAIHQDTLAILHTLVATPGETLEGTLGDTLEATLGETLEATLGIPVVMLEVIPTLQAILAILCIHQAILATLADMDIPMEGILDINCLVMFIIIYIIGIQFGIQ